MKRRAFLQTTAAGITGLAGWPSARLTAGEAVNATPVATGEIGPDGYRAPDWLRYARTVYFDGYTDPLYPHLRNFDARRVVDAVLELGGDTLRFQPISYRAYYPSKAFPVHPELGDRDLIAEVAAECRKSGIHMYCYSGLGLPFLDAELMRQQPRFADWVLRDTEGKPYGVREDFGRGTFYYLCLTGDAFREGMRNVVREICAHETEGMYFDGPSGYRAICFCDSCRVNFKRFSGLDLDRLRNVGIVMHGPPMDADMTVMGAWYDWINKLTQEDLLDIRKIIHSSGKYMLCHNGGTWRPGALYQQYRVPDGFMVEASDQTYQRLARAMMGASLARPTRKLTQMYMGSFDVQAIGQPANSKPWAPHGISLEDSDDIRMEGFAALAGGNMPIYATVNRLLFGLGDGSPNPAQDVFDLARRIEPFTKDSVPVAHVSVVPTWESLELYRAKRENWNTVMSEGFVLAMLDERIGVDVNPSLELTPEWLKTQRVVALCGASGLSDENAGHLATWVREGGALLATYDSGLYDARGQVRHDGGALKEVLGVEMKGEPLDGQANAFYRLRQTHPALAPYREGAMVMADPRLVAVELRAGATLLAEHWSYDLDKSRGPGIVLNSYGKGRAIYVSGSMEMNYVSSRVLSLQRMLGSMVRYLAADAPASFRLEAPKGVYGLLRRAPSGDLALWVVANVGFKDAAVGRMRQEFVPVSNLTASVLIPEGRKVKSIELMRARQTVPFSIEGNYAVFTLPSVHIAEVAHLALE